MELEALEPVHGRLAPCGAPGKDLVLGNPPIVTDLECGRIDKADPCAGAETVLKIHAQRHQTSWCPIDEALIAYQLRKGIAPMFADLALVVLLEVAIVTLMEANQNGHDFAQTQRSCSLTSFQSVRHETLLPLRFKALAKVIDVAKEFF